MERMKVSALLLMALIHFVIMFFIMFAMIDRWEHFHLSLARIYMAALMTAPMLILEIIMMRSMYANRKALIAVGVGSVLMVILLFVFVRQQVGIGDRAFIASMVPHHSSAILMCREADLTDPELRALCESISKTQEEEIEQMEAILRRLDGEE